MKFQKYFWDLKKCLFFSTRELNRDVQQAKLVCFSGWLLEKYRFYCHAAGGSCANPEVDLVLIAVMIISSVV